MSKLTIKGFEPNFWLKPTEDFEVEWDCPDCERTQSFMVYHRHTTEIEVIDGALVFFVYCSDCGALEYELKFQLKNIQLELSDG